MRVRAEVVPWIMYMAILDYHVLMSNLLGMGHAQPMSSLLAIASPPAADQLCTDTDCAMLAPGNTGEKLAWGVQVGLSAEAANRWSLPATGPNGSVNIRRWLLTGSPTAGSTLLFLCMGHQR